MKPEEFRKNRMDLNYQNWISLSNVFVGGGITAVFALWTALYRLGIPFVTRIYITFIGSGFLLSMGLLMRFRAESYMERIRELERKVG
ncbi:MAG: hypothetical protein ABEJ72_05260, partial [Candidatus Aenigmatarchaeota archaeon]